MTSLFGRIARVEIGNLQVEGLDIAFDVVHDAGHLGKAEITIWNLNSFHRKQIEDQRQDVVTLWAGYSGELRQGTVDARSGGLDPGVLFRGTMREATSQRKPPDWITKLKTGDGDKAPTARINKSYGAGTKFETLWRDAVKSITDKGIGGGNALEKFKQGEFKDGITELFNGAILEGSALKELQGLASGLGLAVGLQDGELSVTKVGQPLDLPAVLLTPTTGLIGSPEKGAKGVLKVRSLLIAGLRPQRKIEIKSRDVDGLYVIRRAQYKGDTAGNDWYADLDCTEAP